MVRTRTMNYSPLVNDGLDQKKSTSRESTTNKISDASKLIRRHKLDDNQNVKNGHENKHAKSNGRKHSITIKDEPTNKTVYLIFFSLLLDLLAFTMILPLLPSLLDYYQQNDSAGLYKWVLDSVKYFQTLVGAPERFNSVLFGGIIGSMYSFLQFVASPIVGGLSDVYGRKPIMILCLVNAYIFRFLIF